MADTNVKFSDLFSSDQSAISSVVEEEKLKVPESRGTFDLSRQDPRPISQQTTIDPMSREEIPAVAPPSSEVKYTMEGLLEEPEWIDAAQIIYKKELGKDFRGDPKELGEWFRRRHARLGNDLSYLAYTAARAKKFSPKVKDAWIKSLDMYQATGSDMGSFGRATWQMISDPSFAASIVGTAGLGTLPRILGGRAAGQLGKFQFKKQLIDSLSKEILQTLPAKTLRGKAGEKTARLAARQAAEIGASPLVTRTMLSKARKEAAKNVSKYTTYSGMGAGALWGGGFDLSDQLMNIGIERPGYDDINITRLATTTAFSSLIGGLAGRGIPRISERIGRNKALRQSDIILTELDRLGDRAPMVAHRISKGMTDTDLDSLANQSQIDLLDDGIVELTLDGPRAMTVAQRKADNVSDVIKNNLSVEEIKNTFRDFNIELQPVFGSTKWRGKKVADFGPLPSQPVMSLNQGEQLYGAFGRRFKSDSGLGRHFERARRKFDFSLRSKEAAIHRRVDRLKEAILDDYNINKLDELDTKQFGIFDEVFRGVPSAVKSLEAAKATRTLQELSNMRGDVLDLQKSLWDSGILKKDIDPNTGELKYPLTAKIKKSIDGEDPELYVTRQYELFDNPEWGKLIRQNPEVMQKVQSLLMGQANRLTNGKLQTIHNRVSKQTPKPALKQPTEYNYAGLSDEDIKLHQDFLGENGWMNKLISDILDIHGEEKLFAAMQEPTQIFGKNPLKILTPRGTIHDEVKLLMGEYKDPFSNYMNTVAKLEQTVATYDYEREIADLVRRGIIPNTSTGGAVLGKKITTPLTTRIPRGPGLQRPFEEGKEGAESAVIRPLYGMYANENVADAILNGNHILQETNWLNSGTTWAKTAQGYLLIQGSTRQAKTVYDPSAISRNYIGSAMMAFGAGYVRPKHIPAAMSVFKNMRKNWTDDRIRAETQKDLALGIRQSGVSFGAFRAALEDASSQAFWLGKSAFYKDKKSFIRRAQQANVKAHELYQAQDDVWKKFAFLNEHDNYRKILIDRAHVANLKSQAGKELTIDEERLLAGFRAQGVNGNIAPDQMYNPDLDIVRTLKSGDGLNINITRLDELAADEVNRHMQNYAGVPQFVRVSRLLPLADFLAFNTEIARITKNVTIDSGREAFQGGKLWKEGIYLPDGSRAGAAEAKLGMYRFGSQMAAQSSAYALGSTSLLALGVGGTKAYDATKSFLEGPFSKGNNFMFLGEGEREKDGRLAHKGFAINLSYLNPWAALQVPIRAFMRSLGRDPEGEKKYTDAVVDHFITPFFEMLGGSMLAVSTMNVLRGRDEYGRKLWTDKDPREKKFYRIIMEFINEVKPGGLDWGEEFIGSFDRSATYKGEPVAVKKGKFGQKYTTADSIFDFFGVGAKYYDIPRNMAMEVGAIKSKMKDSGQIFSSMLKELGGVTEEQLVEAYAETLSQEFELSKDLFGVITRAKDAGLDTDQIHNAITGQGFFESRFDQNVLTQMIEDGVYIPAPPIRDDVIAYQEIAKARHYPTLPVMEALDRLMAVYQSYLTANTGTRKTVEEEKEVDSNEPSFSDLFK